MLATAPGTVERLLSDPTSAMDEPTAEMTVPRPPEVPGLPTASGLDAFKLIWWAERGFLYGAWRGSAGPRALSAFLAVAWWPCTPVLLLGEWLALRRPDARYYLSSGRDAVLAVVARPDGWHVQEHYAAVPGTGRGRALRERLVPALLGAADEHGVVIHATALNRGLAEQYSAQVPGLVDVGRGRIRGRRLQRPTMTG